MVTVRRISDTRKEAPVLSWTPVEGPDGRIRMEMRWHVGVEPRASRLPDRAA
ncbi:MAG TPA: hypothetical protein VK045_04790 [Ornithinicoccus sp.]|nr:hypothetical protein [Ornithinicoccus sp.]